MEKPLRLALFDFDGTLIPGDSIVAYVRYLRKKGVPVSVSTVSLLVMTIAYKLVLILMGLLVAVTMPGAVMESLGKLGILFWLGLVVFSAWTLFLILMVFHPRLARSIVVWALSVLEELHILKNREERQTSLEVAMDMYSDTADHIRATPGILAEIFGAALLRRLGMFSVTWCVYKAMGLDGVSWLRIVMLQAAVSVCSDMLPLPGGMGISEALFVLVFGSVFGELALPGMVLSRGIGHYCQLIVSALFTMGALLLLDRGKSGEPEK